MEEPDKENMKDITGQEEYRRKNGRKGEKENRRKCRETANRIQEEEQR